MFSLFKPTRSEVHSLLVKAEDLPLSYHQALNTREGREKVAVARGFQLDHTRSRIGHGQESFEAAKDAFRGWKQFDLGWARVANPEARLATGQLVAVQACTLGFWSINSSRILYTVDEPTRYGFGYGTTPLHVERGEERFLLEYEPDTGSVYYDLLAVSQPAHWLAHVAFPLARRQQRRFAAESHLRMRQLFPDRSNHSP